MRCQGVGAATVACRGAAPLRSPRFLGPAYRGGVAGRDRRAGDRTHPRLGQTVGGRGTVAAARTRRPQKMGAKSILIYTDDRPLGAYPKYKHRRGSVRMENMVEKRSYNDDSKLRVAHNGQLNIPCRTVSTDMLLLPCPPRCTRCSCRDAAGPATGSAMHKTTREATSTEPTASAIRSSAFDPRLTTYPSALNLHHSGVNVKRGCSERGSLHWEGETPGGRRWKLQRAPMHAQALAPPPPTGWTRQRSVPTRGEAACSARGPIGLHANDRPTETLQGEGLKSPSPNKRVHARTSLCQAPVVPEPESAV